VVVRDARAREQHVVQRRHHRAALRREQVDREQHARLALRGGDRCICARADVSSGGLRVLLGLAARGAEDEAAARLLHAVGASPTS
jgi:hypothetical protein